MSWFIFSIDQSAMSLLNQYWVHAKSLIGQDVKLSYIQLDSQKMNETERIHGITQTECC
jgi:hypothetical protein